MSPKTSALDKRQGNCQEKSYLAVFEQFDSVEQIRSNGIDRYNCGEHFLCPPNLKNIGDFVDFLALARHYGKGTIARSLQSSGLLQ